MSQEIKVLLGVGTATIVILLGAVFVLSSNSSSTSDSTTKANPKMLIKENSHQTASSSAKVTIVEFGDYQCPACKAAYPIMKEILASYGNKINFIFRHLAFLGPESTWAAQAAECANEQGKFWEFHDYLYEHQGKENSGAFSKDNLKGFAKSIGLDTNKFNSCLDSDSTLNKVTPDINDAKTLGVNSTPTFFINGKMETGVPNYSDLKSQIDSLLK